MAKLRKTLPKDFDEIVAGGDVEIIKAALKKCEPNAYCNNYYKESALMNPNLPEEVIRWLVTEYGADIHYSNLYGRTALSEAAMSKPENIALLVSLGADVNFQKDSHPTALIYAAMYYRTESVRELLRLGADVHMTGGYSHYNALEEALFRCQNANIPDMVELSRILLDAGLEITGDMKAQVTRIGEQFEFYRDSFNPDYLDEVDAALQELYRIYDVPPVPRKQKYDGSAPIAVKGETWQQQYNELWNLLVPGTGGAKYVQGEVIRIAGRLSHEILDNGGMNWDADYRAMRDQLAALMATGRAADEKILKTVRKVSPYSDEGVFDEIAKAAVEWILSNPDPLELGDVPYNR